MVLTAWRKARDGDVWHQVVITATLHWRSSPIKKRKKKLHQVSLSIFKCFQRNETTDWPKLIDELAAVIRVADRVGIPLDFKPLQLGTVLCQTDDNLVYVDACTQSQKPTVRCSHPKNSERQTTSSSTNIYTALCFITVCGTINTSRPIGPILMLSSCFVATVLVLVCILHSHVHLFSLLATSVYIK